MIENNCQTLSPTSRRWMIAGMIVIALETLYFWIMEFSLARGLLSRDGYTYLLFVEEALENGWATAHQKFPLMKNYPPFLMLSMYYFSSPLCPAELVGRGLNFLAVLLTGQGVWFCARKLYQRPATALASAIIVMALPKIYLEGCDILRDPLYWAEMVWMIYLTMNLVDHFKRPEVDHRAIRKYTLALGILSALSILTRKEGIPLSMVIGLTVLILYFKNRTILRRNQYLILAVYALLILLAAFLPRLLGYDWWPWNILETKISLGDRI